MKNSISSLSDTARILNKWCDDSGSLINPKKCSIFKFGKSLDKEFNNYGLHQIPLLNEKTGYKYLGIKFKIDQEHFNDYINDLSNDFLKKSKNILSNPDLNPAIKLRILKMFLYPKLNHIIRLQQLPKINFKQIDKGIRNYIKLNLNLPNNISSHFFIHLLLMVVLKFQT